MSKKLDLGVCAITSSGYAVPNMTHPLFVELVLRGGANMIQFRDKTLSDRELYATGVALRAVCSAYNAKLIVNDRVDIALAIGADGVHLGQNDLPVQTARMILGPSKIIGATSNSLQDVLTLNRQNGSDVDYIGFGHLFPTISKEKKDEPKGIKMLKEVCEQSKKPIMAIGGIISENAGAKGVAVISALANSHDPEGETQKLITLSGLVLPSQNADNP
ncbi:hypothetical protein CHS0354_023947 [Potamilus streckersoni]|uniref:thiamine phosphate synthase n=1 Tax=Potamilus streckersoni TaxID=2493646 RepID=A0AAE0RZA3_9BIVA|nr:hypothetical protein CHS0354_023947 [Potamilus streckersoni]